MFIYISSFRGVIYAAARKKRELSPTTTTHIFANRKFSTPANGTEKRKISHARVSFVLRKKM